MIDSSPFIFSLKLSAVTIIILFFITLPLAYLMATKEFKEKSIIETIVSLPLVLPPSVLGFYILIFLSLYSFIGKFFNDLFGIRLVFNFQELVIASCIYSLPFMFQLLVAGFRSMPKSLV